MKFCLRSRLSPRFLAQADEIRVDYRDRAAIPDLYEKYRGKTIILFPPNYNDDPYDWDQITMFNLLCEKNFILNCPNISIAVMAKEHEIRFMLDKEISTYWELSGLEELGAEYAYVGIPLFFDLDGTLNFSIKLRVIPTMAYSDFLPHPDGICGKWIRPEDLDVYEDYIETIEFEQCDVKREETLFKVYANDKKWSTRLDILIKDLGSPAVNRMIPPELAEARINCKQHCMKDDKCHLCQNLLKFADPALISSIIEKDNIEK